MLYNLYLENLVARLSAVRLSLPDLHFRKVDIKLAIVLVMRSNIGPNLGLPLNRHTCVAIVGLA